MQEQLLQATVGFSKPPAVLEEKRELSSVSDSPGYGFLWRH